jgi:hypothetical protein
LYIIIKKGQRIVERLLQRGADAKNRDKNGACQRERDQGQR